MAYSWKENDYNTGTQVNLAITMKVYILLSISISLIKLTQQQEILKNSLIKYQIPLIKLVQLIIKLVQLIIKYTLLYFMKKKLWLIK